MYKLIQFIFNVTCFAAADDKACPVGNIKSGHGLQAAIIVAASGDSCSNIVAEFQLPINDSIGPSGGHKFFWYYTRNAPGSDYPNAPIGSMCTYLTVASGAVTAATLYMKTNATTWTVAGSLS